MTTRAHLLRLVALASKAMRMVSAMSGNSAAKVEHTGWCVQGQRAQYGLVQGTSN